MLKKLDIFPSELCEILKENLKISKNTSPATHRTFVRKNLQTERNFFIEFQIIEIISRIKL
jgi:hypothetical protein